MAETYKTDDEQLDELKKWWRENGTSTVTTIALAVAGVFGWQGWQKSQQAELDAASAIYQNLLDNAASSASMSVEQRATATHLADTLKEDFPNSTYADFAALYKARFAVEIKNLPMAESELRWILDGGATNEIILQTKLRLARVLYGQEKYDEALAQLEGDAAAGYAASYAEVRGDIYDAQGNTEKALLSYQKAKDLNAQAEKPVANPLLNLKFEQLSSKVAAKGEA